MESKIYINRFTINLIGSIYYFYLMKLNTFLTASLILLSVQSFAQKEIPKSKNLVLILIDGYRWQELFHGAEYGLLTNPKYNSMDSLQRMKDFWSDNVNERREKLMPFTWNYIANHGQIYGDRDSGNDVSVKNPYWISYPGRAEVLSGFVDLKISSNDYGINTNPNVLEFLSHQSGFEGKVATFACWDATGRCLDKPNSAMLINVPWKEKEEGRLTWEDIRGDHLTNEEILANEVQHYAPKIFGDDERPDFAVYALAKSYIRAKHPKVIYIDFGDTDEYAHEGKYDHYLLDAYNLDAMIEKLWEMMLKDPFYRNNTTFFVIPDHGRGIDGEWTSHGSSIPHSDETWFMVWGSGIKPLGVINTREQIYQEQYAKTMAQILGYHYRLKGHAAGKSITSVVN